MPARKKLVVVLSVLVTGASTALFFRKDASQLDFRQEASPENPFQDRVARRVAADSAWAKSLRGSQSTTVPPSRPALRVPAVATAAIAEPQGLAPEAPPTFHKLSNPVGALLEPIEDVMPEDAESDGAEAGDVAADDGNFLSGAPRTHPIADGDTLSQLSGRYLGHADRYLEIYELNRGVLASPDLLPIGVVLKIPPRQNPAPAKLPREVPAGPSEGLLEPLLPLVPLEDSGQRASRSKVPPAEPAAYSSGS